MRVRASEGLALVENKLDAGKITCLCVRPNTRLQPYIRHSNLITVRTFYYSCGTQLYCAPTVDARPVWQNTMTHIALEGRCFVLSACQYAEEKDYPPDHPVANATCRKPENVMIAGGSVIISPLGKVLAGPLLGKEGILTAELDLDDIARGKFDLDIVGHYARPDSKLVRSDNVSGSDAFIIL